MDLVLQVRTTEDLNDLDGIVLPGGESTAMGLIGTSSVGRDGRNVWEALKDFTSQKPTWGTCAGMILLAEQCVGASAVIENGQALIGGMDILVCRNYFGSQISSFEMATPPPPPLVSSGDNTQREPTSSYPGVFIRAPAILSAGPDVKVLGRVVATPCRQAAVVLHELEQKILNGEKVVQMGVVDALERKSSQEITYRVVVKHPSSVVEEEKKEMSVADSDEWKIELPGAADESNAREVICAVQKHNLLCTAFHPELTNDYRWHEYFANMVRQSKLE
jgi:5'-phosphate synthase pdxT subunit